MINGLNVYLIGMMGSGKSTVGKELAQKLNYRFFDTDVLIEQVAQKTINEIFTQDSESAFRQMETQILAELSSNLRLAIATGGGIVLKRENWSYLHHGLIVWLDAPIEVLLARLAADNTRPLLQNPDPAGTLQQLLNQRQELYAQADLRISITNDETPEEIASRILEAIPQVLKPPVIPPMRNDEQ